MSLTLFEMSIEWIFWLWTARVIYFDLSFLLVIGIGLYPDFVSLSVDKVETIYLIIL